MTGCVGTGRIVAVEILMCTGSTLWLRACGKIWNSLRCARSWSLQRSVYDCRMLRWSSSSFARVCQRVFQNLSFSGAERWLVLELPPEVDLSSRPRVPEFMVRSLTARTWPRTRRISCPTELIPRARRDTSSKSWFRCQRGSQQIVDQSLHDFAAVAERVTGYFRFWRERLCQQCIWCDCLQVVQQSSYQGLEG